MPCVVIERFLLGSDILFPGYPLDLPTDAAERMIAAGKVRRDDMRARWRQKHGVDL